ncbi:MAG: serine/threonine protein kinase [Deltaproteobacteria bacterium]|nr:serine/threonine protein kinase [Deltaproteobacteria bacterium]
MAGLAHVMLVPGTMIGPYQLLFRLGQGGMGQVWAARRPGDGGHTEASRALFAVKLMIEDEASSERATLFQDEATATMALSHPSIVKTHDSGKDGLVFYLSMELIQGPALSVVLQRLALRGACMAPHLVAFIGVRVLEALSYAHETATHDGRPLMLIHRDVSPQNVILSLDGRILLTDFGVARTDIQSHHTVAGVVRGKPSYMAPEQVRGLTVDRRTDVFAVGTVLYEASCVRRLFGRSNPFLSMEAVLKSVPRPLPIRVPGYPEPLWRVIAKCLEKDANNRYQRALDAAKDLRRFLKRSEREIEAQLRKMLSVLFAHDEFEIEQRLAMADRAIEAQRLAYELDGDTEILAPPDAAWPTGLGADPLDPHVLRELRQRDPSGVGNVPQPAIDDDDDVDNATLDMESEDGASNAETVHASDGVFMPIGRSAPPTPGGVDIEAALAELADRTVPLVDHGPRPAAGHGQTSGSPDEPGASARAATGSGMLISTLRDSDDTRIDGNLRPPPSFWSPTSGASPSSGRSETSGASANKGAPMTEGLLAVTGANAASSSQPKRSRLGLFLLTILVSVLGVAYAVGTFNQVGGSASFPAAVRIGQPSSPTRSAAPSSAVGPGASRRIVVATDPPGLPLFEATQGQALGTSPITIHLDEGETFRIFAKMGDITSEPQELGGSNPDTEVQIRLRTDR